MDTLRVTDSNLVKNTLISTLIHVFAFIGLMCTVIFISMWASGYLRFQTDAAHKADVELYHLWRKVNNNTNLYYQDWSTLRDHNLLPK